MTDKDLKENLLKELYAEDPDTGTEEGHHDNSVEIQMSDEDLDSVDFE